MGASLLHDGLARPAGKVSVECLQDERASQERCFLQRFILFFWMLAIAGFSIRASVAADRQDVTWIAIHLPPAEIKSGPDRDSGMIDVFRHRIIERLPQFNHSLDYANAQRRDALFERGHGLCTVSMIQTPERDKHTLFTSKPFIYIMPLYAITRGDRLSAFKPYLDHDAVDLSKALSSGKLVLGRFSSYSFGPSVDQMIDQIMIGHPNVVVDFTQAPNASMGTLLELLDRGRFDFILGHLISMNYEVEHHSELNKFVFLPVAGSPPLLPIRIGCTRDDVGKRVIGTINAMRDYDQLGRNVAASYLKALPASMRGVYAERLAKAGFGEVPVTDSNQVGR